MEQKTFKPLSNCTPSVWGQTTGIYYTGWFKVYPVKQFRAGNSRRFWELGPDFLHACAIKPS